MTAPYPLIFEPILLEKVWGGRRLERYGKALPAGVRIGESWELADLDRTSSGGAGGGPARSVIANGVLKGGTVREALRLWGGALLGAARATSEGGFPLLVKFLDARENLSVQVHPSAAYAAAHAECHLKSECWYILEAEPGSLIYKGLKPGVTREELARRIAEGTVVEALTAVPAVAGECHDLPSGTCHALGAGVVVAEVQTPSDTTFRLYDWGRAGRELHVGPALACVEEGPAPAATRLAPGQRVARLVKTEFFDVDACDIAVGESEPAGLTGGGEPGPSCAVLMLLSGEGELVGPGSERTAVRAGDTVLVPASVAGRLSLKALSRSRVLRVALRG